jgi:hypothetical protein
VGLPGRGTGVCLLRQNASDPEKGSTFHRQLGRGAVLGVLELVNELRHQRVRIEAGWRMELKPSDDRKGPLGAEELLGPLDLDATTSNLARVGPEPRPLASVPDETGRDGVGEDVDHLLDDGLRGLEPDRAVAIALPEGFPAAQGAVDGPSGERVEVAVEVGKARARIGQDDVDVV